MPKLSDILAHRLTHYRKVRGLSQEELGKLCGLSRVTISGYESGKGFTLDGIARIAQALKIEETDLVSTNEPATPIEKQVTPAEALTVLDTYIKQQEALRLVPAEIAAHFSRVTNWSLLQEVLKTIAPLKE